MPIRKCVVCRKRREKRHLLQLHTNTDGCLIPAERPQGRSAWVCMTKCCLSAVQEHPGRASATFRRKITSTKNLQKFARNRVFDALCIQLEICMRSGLISKEVTTKEQIPTTTDTLFIHATPDTDTFCRLQTETDNQVKSFQIDISKPYLLSLIHI